MQVREELLKSTQYLEAAGMTRLQLARLHHFILKNRQINFRNVYNYFPRHDVFLENNSDFAHRVIFVAQQHRVGQNNIDALVTKALNQWPLV